MSEADKPFNIRPYERSDLEQAAGVMYRSASLAYWKINWHADEKRVHDAFADRQVRKWTDIQVSISGGEVNGVMCLVGSHVDQLFVEPDWQGKGVGKALLDRVKAAFPDGFTLDVFEKNTAALGFYSHLGFQIIDNIASQLEGERELRLKWLP